MFIDAKFRPWAKAVLAGTTVGFFLLLGGAPGARADRYSSCQRSLSRADHRVHEAAEHHGWNSRQAEHARLDLRRQRERCWTTHHRWWNEDDRRWHTDRDWDDHDHDHR